MTEAHLHDCPVWWDGEPQALYRAVASRDRRFDGRFVLGVTSTGIYCRPSCPARTPRPENVRYFAVPAAAVAAGYRACRRCRPERQAVHPNVADTTGLVERALTLIAQGIVDDVGVAGLAARLSVSERHLHRMLVGTVGTGAASLAQARRARTARTLLEQTPLSSTDVAFAAGFGSLRQFNDVMRAEYGATPTELRRSPAKPDRPAADGSLSLRLPIPQPWDGPRLIAFLRSRAVTGVEDASDGRYRRAFRTGHGPAVIELAAGADGAHVDLWTKELAAVGPAMAVIHRLCDAGADIAAVEQGLNADPQLRGLVRRRPGLRVPGAVDGWEILVRAIVGQQVSVPAAATLLGRIVERCGEPLSGRSGDGVCMLFPTPEMVAQADLAGLGLTGARTSTVLAAAEAAADDQLLLEPGDDPIEARSRLRTLRGVGPWTAEYVAMRALADPDAWPGTDLVLERVAKGRPVDRLRPWRAYAAIHWWTQAGEERKTA